MLNSEDRIFGLDLMRALAIGLVFVGHCVLIYPDLNPAIASALQVFAFLGVEIFFVLSGFLIGRILYRLYVSENYTVKSVIYFLRRRWLRTLPLYYFVLLINILIAVFYAGLPDDLWKYFLFIQNFNQQIPLFFPESWSLSVEEFSYLLLPFILLVFGILLKPKNRSLFFLVCVILLVLAAFFAKLNYHQVTQNRDINVWNYSLKMVVIYRLDAIYLGVLCSWIALNFKSFWIASKWIFCFAGLLLIGFMFTGIGYFQLLIQDYPLLWNVFYLPIITFGIALFLPVLSEWKKTGWFIYKPVTFLSLISYSVYLLHYSIILQLMRYAFVMDENDTLLRYLFTFAYAVITIILSYVTYTFIERPILRFRDKS